jgi:hypothetical protein
MTKRTIGGIVYNTDTATYIGDVGNSDWVPASDFDWLQAGLYQTPRGHYFLEGEGGARSAFATTLWDGWIGGGHGVVPLTWQEALECAEASENRSFDVDRDFCPTLARSPSHRANLAAKAARGAVPTRVADGPA